ncbi:hypothetical protein [Gordonibacter massiliensis (ex Traore et al. 2017)]|uniref:hypothetical protein n=1 Tax=Gordonibacter massiliensis (ex Traore et al. 2017) TaxID=1841863 RepID=UPI001C8C8053|nr:hypothetical protein [Gordonibacter massiliensis (ex Traore et al. 2017)]MBX9032680.1 hypothetical protein [Gordonibacter massiliensis (ex Traore et al. 2017)]
MAVKASGSITLAVVVDVASVARYYRLQSSTLAKPAKPTANPPSGWTATEPAYTAGATNSLYTCELTVLSDNTWSYSDVSLSSSYEAAKLAYNEAKAAQDAAEEAAKTATSYLEYTSAGLDVGNRSGGKWSGFRTRMAASAFQVLDAAGAVLASYGASAVELGVGAANAVIKMCGGRARVSYGGNTLTVASDSGAGGARISSGAADVATSTVASVMAHNKGSIQTEGARVDIASTDKPRALLFAHELALWNNADLNNPVYLADTGRAGAMLSGRDWVAYSVSGYSGLRRVLPGGRVEVVGTVVRTMGDYHCDLMSFDTLRSILGATAAQVPTESPSIHVAVTNGHWEANAASLESPQASQTGVIRVTKRDPAGSCVGSIRINYRILLTNTTL